MNEKSWICEEQDSFGKICFLNVWIRSGRTEWGEKSIVKERGREEQYERERKRRAVWKRKLHVKKPEPQIDKLIPKRILF